MKTYTLTEAQQLVKDGEAFIENDTNNIDLLSKVLRWNNCYGACKYYNDWVGTNNLRGCDGFKIKLSQIQPDPIPNDVLKIVEKYGVDKMITYFELIKK